ncbi:hypothetical protein SK128_023768 [Halocaridina rubra]|uniref:Uncharacterized protein n=1 Tax=Halocaridina rubra TaxID=373956 RepID=A0AAN9ABT4_HALRR
MAWRTPHGITSTYPCCRRENLATRKKTYENDIALVRLTGNLDFSDPGLGAVCIPALGTTENYAGTDGSPY